MRLFGLPRKINIKDVCKQSARFFIVFFLGSLTISLLSCDSKREVPNVVLAEWYPGGETTVGIVPSALFVLPAKNLNQEHRPNFYAGKALANQPWVKAPTTTVARDGLGPIYNARSCLACHVRGGRGVLPDSQKKSLFSTVVRVSLRPNTKLTEAQKLSLKTTGVIADPIYGDQLQTQSVSLASQLGLKYSLSDGATTEVRPEAQVHIRWKEKLFSYPDGEKMTLRWPVPEISELAYGELDDEAITSLRIASSLHGMGLLELIDQKDINDWLDPNDTDGDGVSGRLNWVWDRERNATVEGRFGWKANRPTLRDVSAAAFVNDIGITSHLYPEPPCSSRQPTCLNATHGNDEGGVELRDDLLVLVTDFVRNTGVVKSRKVSHTKDHRGRSLFYDLGCALCHRPSYITKESSAYPHLSNQTIWPYSDLLVHDMGVELDDGRDEYVVSGSEWRTPPLWGVGLSRKVNGSAHLLHDGRARNVEEAILWHGGEGLGAKNKYTQLEKTDRQLLIEFVESI